MAYVIKKGAGVWRTVRWDEAADDGAVETAELRVKFRRMGIEEAEALNNRCTAGSMPMSEFFEAVAIDWEAPAGVDGHPLPFTAEGRAQMLDVPGFPPSLQVAFWQMWQGMPDERAGNSKASDAGGPAAGEATADQLAGPTA